MQKVKRNVFRKDLGWVIFYSALSVVFLLTAPRRFLSCSASFFVRQWFHMLRLFRHYFFLIYSSFSILGACVPWLWHFLGIFTYIFEVPTVIKKPWMLLTLFLLSTKDVYHTLCTISVHRIIISINSSEVSSTGERIKISQLIFFWIPFV